MSRPNFRFTLILTLAWMAGSGVEAQVSVLTGHNDNARTGLNTNETVLTPAIVNSNSFGKLFSKSVDGPVYAQPLYVSSVTIPGKGVHNVVYVSTMHDSLYAFDADSDSSTNTPPLWKKSFINPAAGITAVPTTDAVDFPGQDCRTFVGEIGIVGTPAIDAVSGTLYLVTRTKEASDGTFIQAQRLHAIDISTGNERSNSPVTITATVNGTGAGSVGGMVSFNPARLMQRPGLLLSGGVVYIGWCSYCDLDPFHGWIIGYDAQTLQQMGAFNATPNAMRGGIWMGGAGLAGSPEGAIYCITGNGTFDTGANPQNFGDSFLKLTQGAGLALADYFTPHDQAAMDSADDDLGSGGAIVLPDSVGSLTHPHLLVGCSKLGKIYLVDRDNMGHFNAADDSQIVQSMNLFSLQSGPPHYFGVPAYFNNRLYVQGVGEVLKAYAFNGGQLSGAILSQAPAADVIGFRGATPSISASNTSNGIVWVVAPRDTVEPSLRAYNAEDLSQKLYDSYLNTQRGLPDKMNYVKFVLPTVANGKVYVGTIDSLAVFGLRSIIRSITRNGNLVNLNYIGPDGTVVQISTDLIHWTDLGSGTATGVGSFVFTDNPGPVTRFYRLR